MSNHSGTSKLLCDVAIIFAIREERDAAMIFDDSAERLPNSAGLDIQRRNLADVHAKEIKVITLLLDDQGPEHAAIATTKFLGLIQPKLMILIGISGRISNDVCLGDVVLASLCDNSYYRAKKKNHKILPGGREWSLQALANPLYSALDQAPPYYSYDSLDEENAKILRVNALIGKSPRTAYGPICATSFVVDDPDFAEWLKTSRNRHVLATDMESAAVVQAAYESGIRDGCVLVIRGISDLADGNKSVTDMLGSGIMRRIAMQNASQLASHCVSRLLSFSDATVKLRSELEAGRTKDNQGDAFGEAMSLLLDVSSQCQRGISELEVCKWFMNRRALNSTVNRQISDLSNAAHERILSQNSSPMSPLLDGLEDSSIDILAASFVMDQLIVQGSVDRAMRVLTNVYPQRINRFCKAFMTNLPDEKRLVDTLINAYSTHGKRARGSEQNGSGERARAHICYLLGRVRSPQQRSRASASLLKWRLSLVRPVRQKNELKNHDQRFHLERAFDAIGFPERRLLLRTICISLIMLENQGESDAYVRACLRNKEFDSLNRGFHLEYYGDIDYDPGVPLNSEDPVALPGTRTFEILLRKLVESYRQGRSYALRDVDLQTLLSLCQHRHEQQVLDDTHRTKVLQFLNEFGEERLTDNRLLHAYISMLRGQLTVPVFRRVDLLRQLYILKKMPRSGWNDCYEAQVRRTPNPESVLSHTAGGLLLIYFCLPDKLSEDDKTRLGEDAAGAYSKDVIARTFLSHDLAEAYTGDLTPRQRDDVTRAQERRINSHIDLWCTWTDFYHFGMYRSWDEFEGAKNINGRVAKEIDALENLLQLIIESTAPGVFISDLEQWKANCAQKIETPMGRRILEILTEPKV